VWILEVREARSRERISDRIWRAMEELVVVPRRLLELGDILPGIEEEEEVRPLDKRGLGLAAASLGWVQRAFDKKRGRPSCIIVVKSFSTCNTCLFHLHVRACMNVRRDQLTDIRADLHRLTLFELEGGAESCFAAVGDAIAYRAKRAR